MALRVVRRLSYAMGAEIAGVDAAVPLSDETVAAVRAAWMEHIVLCFPGQNLNAAQLKAFAERFGELDVDSRGRTDRKLEDVPAVRTVTSRAVVVDGKKVGGYGADHWHSDLSFTLRPGTGTFLVAKELPDVGGNTMFANQYLAYETLSPAMRETIAPLRAVHDYTLGPFYRSSTPEVRAEIAVRNPPVVHPLVRVHPETGRKALFVGSRVRRFVGMTEEESRPLLDFLLRHAVRYEFLYRHVWTVGDLVMWDNRCSLHYAVQDFDPTQLRRMLRVGAVGPQTGELAATASP